MALNINGQFVDDAAIEQEFGSIKSYFESLGNVSCCERDEEFRGYARENVIARVLLAQQAERTIEEPTESEIDEVFQKMAHEQGGEEQLFAAMGMGPDQLPQLRENIGLSIRVDKLVRSLEGDAGEPTDAQLRAWYEQHIDRFQSIEQVRALHILKAPRKSEDREPAYQTLREVRKRLQEGADFRKEAEAHSDKPIEEVDLGLFKRGELMEEFDRVVFSMNIGEISPVFVSPFGFHLVQLTEHLPPQPIPFDEVRDEVLEQYILEHRESAVKDLVEELKESASIEDVDEDADEEEDSPRHSAYNRDDD